MTCTDSTEWATASTKECLEVVRIVMVIFLFWSRSETLLGCCSAWCNLSPNLLAAPDTEWLRRNLHLSCVRLRAFLSLRACRWEVSVPRAWCFAAHTQGSDRWNELKKHYCWMRSGKKQRGNVVHLRLPEIRISLGQICNEAQGLQKYIPAAPY